MQLPRQNNFSGRVTMRGRGTGGRGWMLVVAALTVACLFFVGCSDRPEARGTLFDRAEKHYRRGDYEPALREYQAFLNRFPASPLAQTAERRIQSIRFEVETVLSADHSFIPAYTGGDQTAQELGSMTDEHKPKLPENITDQTPASSNEAQ